MFPVNLAEGQERKRVQSDPAWNSLEGYKTSDYHSANAGELDRLLDGRDVTYPDHPLSADMVDSDKNLRATEKILNHKY